MTTLGGRVDEPVEALMSPFQLDDASVELTVGAELLLWLEPKPEERRFARLAALEPDGDAYSSATASQPGHLASIATSNATAEVSQAQNSSPESSLIPTDHKPPHSDPVTKRQPRRPNRQLTTPTALPSTPATRRYP
jgi:hypothetical protein